jgi:acyl-CoA thioesterase-1
MFPISQAIIARVVRAGAASAVLGVFVAAHILGFFVAAHAEVPAPALFVAPTATAVAAPAGTPAATSAIGASGTRQLAPTAAPIASPQITCKTANEFTHFDHPLLHTARRLASGEPLTIVAIGSSSTAGAGASSTAASYPSRLAVELKEIFPAQDITVLNRGVNGEETLDMISRFETGVIAEHPQLVIWQVGTNSVLRDHPLAPHAAELHEGIEELKATGADVALIDPQYAPKVIVKSETMGMVEQIALTAKEENVDVFHRFAVMRDWYEVQHLSFDTFVSPDGLHMNDWGYACVAKLLATGIAEAANRPVAAASVHAAH